MNIALPQETLFQTSAIPYPTGILRKRPWYSFVRQNGYANLAKRLMVKVVSDMQTAEYLWNIFSPNKSLFDLWEVRRAFSDSFKLDPYFITVYEQSQDGIDVLGMLPLWLDNDEYEGDYTWFGGFWPEDNTFFVKDVEVIPLLLMVAPQPLFLHSIAHSPEYEFLKTLKGYEISEDKKYWLNISSTGSVDEYLGMLKKKKRHNIRRDRKNILSLSPSVVYGAQSHIDRMYELNIDRMNELKINGHKDSSIFESSGHRSLFHNLIARCKEATPRIVSTTIHGQVEAVEMGFVYKDIYYALTAGANVKKYSGLGVFSNILVIEDAIRQGCSRVDFMSIDYNWKESWGFETLDMYQFKK